MQSDSATYNPLAQKVIGINELSYDPALYSLIPLDSTKSKSAANKIELNYDPTAYKIVDIDAIICNKQGDLFEESIGEHDSYSWFAAITLTLTSTFTSLYYYFSSKNVDEVLAGEESLFDSNA